MAILTALVVLIGSPGTVAANAASSDDQLTPEMIERITDFWSEHGIATGTQADLVRKLQSGAVLDATAANVEPVRESSVEYPDRFETVTYYPDGSIMVTTVEKPDVVAPLVSRATSISPFSIRECQTSVGGSGYRNFYDCRVDASSGQVTLGFNMSYSLVQGGYDKIMSANTPFGVVAGGTLSPNPPKLEIKRQTENLSGRAYAEVESTLKPMAGGSITVRARAYVGADTAYTTFYKGS